MSKKKSKGKQGKYLKNFINLLVLDLHKLIFHTHIHTHTHTHNQ